MGAHWKLRGYVLERLLGSGASADVWCARTVSGGERVALKRIVPGDAEQAARARAEAALLSALDHPNLIRLHAAVPSDDALVLVLDLADHGSLRDLLVARGRLTPGEAVTALAPIAAAVSYLHSESVVHGDVSAGNILFTDAGVPLLADVGVARLTGDDRDAESTPLYLDPAVAAGGVPGPASDVFMLGAVALHALTGHPLWQAADAEATVALAARGVPDDLAARLADSGVPEAIAAPVLRALSAQPHRRGTAVELALDLRHGAVPLRIDFDAGRERPEPTLVDRAAHALAPLDGDDASPAEQHPPGCPAGPGRPSFDRPHAVPAAGHEPPTRMVGPRPRPAIPRSTRRAARARAAAARRRRTWAGVLACVLLGCGAVALWLSVTAGGASRRSVPHPVGRAPSSARIDTSAQRPAPSAGTIWMPVLTGLDAIRSEAYATRRPALLERVYLPGDLLTEDSDQLRRMVPTGCGLAGALTAYRDLRVRATASGATEITVTATLPATRLVCDEGVRGAAGATGPRRLSIRVVQTAAGPRIAAERAA